MVRENLPLPLMAQLYAIPVVEFLQECPAYNTYFIPNSKDKLTCSVIGFVNLIREQMNYPPIQ